jgi:aminopeptidase N
MIRDEPHYYTINQFYQIDFPIENLPAAHYRLKLSYTGDYGPSTNLVGFYKTAYSEDGMLKQIVATKFQPTDARKA